MSEITLPLVSVGIPTYNNPEGLRRTLECITNQTYTNLEIIVSDNCSPDPRVMEVLSEFLEKDSRIRLYRQKENKGVLFNFEFVLKKAQGLYFFWAADDDEWDPEFLDACVSGLQNAPDAGFAFCNITSIDSFGRVIREIPSFKSFANEDRYASITSYVLTPEFLGKANLFYSVYRLALLKDYWSLFLSVDSIANRHADKVFVLGLLCRFRIVIDERVLFKKGLRRSTDQPEKPDPIPTGLPYVKVWTKKEQDMYFNNMKIMSANTPYAELVSCLLDYRKNLNNNLLDLQMAG